MGAERFSGDWSLFEGIGRFLGRPSLFGETENFSGGRSLFEESGVSQNRTFRVQTLLGARNVPCRPADRSDRSEAVKKFFEFG